MRQRIFENWEFNDYEFLPSQTAEVEIIESNGKKLKEGVLGIVRGPSFFGDSYSRNGRFYPKELWENALKNPEFQRNLKRGLIFSCIGHPENYSLDELLASGATAARVKDIQFDGKEGIVTYEILDTPAGRILNTILRSGSKPYVSTRGFGSFLNETKEWNGRKVPILNPNDYYLESIDFVINPGFLETDPNLMESVKEDLHKLQESNIKCIDGICHIKTENKLSNLSKEELIDIIESLKKENEYLIRENTNSNSDKTFKHKKLFFAYLEILLQLLKYNVEYKEYYEKLSQYIDSDSLDNKELQDIKNICENINENILDESIKEILKSLIKIIDINLGKQTDDNVKEGIVNYVYRYWDLMQQVNIEKENCQKLQKENKIIQQAVNKLIDTNEMFQQKIDKLLEINYILKEEKKQIEKKYNILEEKFEIIKEQLNEKIKNLDEENSKLEAIEDSLLEKLEIYKEKYKTEKDKNKKLLEENKLLEKDLSKKIIMEKELNELKSVINKLENELLIKEETIEKLNNNINKLITENKELKYNISKMNESLNDNSKEVLIEELNQLKTKLSEKENTEKNLKLENNKLLIKFLQEKYKIDFVTIEAICKKFDYNIKLIEKELSNIKESSIKESEYIAFDVKEEKLINKKYEMLENLIK